MSVAVLAVDQGTTNTKALLIDAAGTILARASRRMNVFHPQPGWVEQSPDEIWQAVQKVIAECLAARPDVAIAAIGISNQRESVLLWDRKSGKALGPCVTWQCRRSAERLEPLRNAETETLVAERSGLSLDPMFPAAKIGWLLDSDPCLRGKAVAGEICAGTVDSWLLFNLTGGAVHATDVGNASRTQLLDIRRAAWDEDLARLFDVPLSVLPAVLPSDAPFGVTGGGLGLPEGLPILAMMGDSHAALFGHGVRKPGVVKATYGTGTSLMTLTAEPLMSRHGLSTTIAWGRGDEVSYALEGNISVSGQGAAFVTQLLGLADEDALGDLAQTVSSSEGVTFVPALAGLGAPYWRDDARGLITGMTLGTGPAHVARACLEAIALQVMDVFVAMEADLGAQLAELSADGGASRSKFLMQLQADLLDRPVRRNPVAELSAVGAGIMAGIKAGVWDEEGAGTLFQDESARFVPGMAPDAREKLISTWRAAVAQALGRGRPET
ncbi:MAG TPA: FGGY-family carbohydrate kinase [Devosiaceae bacterium]